VSIEEEIYTRLQQMDVVTLLGGLVPENAAAKLLGYTPSYFRQMASAGQSPLSYVRRGNRRFYKIADISKFVTETA
jgi:hypothetical protein